MNSDDEEVGDLADSDDDDNRGNSLNPLYEIPLKFEEVSHSVSTYGDSHRFLIQYIMRKRGVVTKKQFWIRYIRTCTCLENRSPLVSQYVEASLQQLEELTRRLIKKINERLLWMKMELKEVRHEVSGKELVCLISKHPYHSGLPAGMGFKNDEVYLVAKWIDHVFLREENDGAITIGFLTRLAADLPNPIPASEVQELIERLMASNWICAVSGTDSYSLAPRGIAELENVLRAKFRSTCCELCAQIVARRSLAVQCPECTCIMHKPCFIRFLEEGPAGSARSCPGRCAGCTRSYKAGDDLPNALVSKLLEFQSQETQHPDDLNTPPHQDDADIDMD